MQIKDDLENVIVLNQSPQQIISLVPSITKTIADLGGGSSLIAVTNFCKYPAPLIKTLPRLGGPKKVKTDEIIRLNPDIIFAVKEENSKEQIEFLQQHFPVVVFDINTVGNALKMIITISEILNNKSAGLNYVREIENRFASLKKMSKSETLTAYLIWKDPWMAAGTGTFISSMMQVAGFENIIAGRYPVIRLEDLKNAQTVFLSSEPYHFTETHRSELQKIFPKKNFRFVDGEMFSWYGTMMLEAAEYFTGFLRNNKAEY